MLYAIFKQHPLASDVVFLSGAKGGGGGGCQFICEHCLFRTAYGTSVRRCKMQIQGSLTLNEAVTVTGALLKSTHHSTPGRNSRGDPQFRAPLSFPLSPSLSAPPTSSLQYNSIHHSSDRHYCMHAALIYRLILHPAFLKGRPGVVSKSCYRNNVPTFAVSFNLGGACSVSVSQKKTNLCIFLCIV